MNKPLFIVFLFLGGISFCQNLVPNPSFEDTVYCPNGINDLQALANWFNPTIATPDYYNACGNNGSGVPSNDFGYQEAQDGNGYSGIVTYGQTPTATNYREYLEVELLEQLVAGKTYHWCMYVSLLDSADFASNNIGISLTNSQLSNFSNEEMLISPIYWYTTDVIIDNINWTELSGSFMATGGEKFLTIGNFYTQFNTSYQQVNSFSLNGNAAYYYIDNVYLGVEPCTEVNIEMPNIFTPNNDGLNEIFTFKEAKGIFDYSITIYNRWGNCVYFNENNLNWDGTFNGEPVTEGLYFYRIDYNENERKTGFVQVVR